MKSIFYARANQPSSKIWALENDLPQKRFSFVLEAPKQNNIYMEFLHVIPTGPIQEEFTPSSDFAEGEEKGIALSYEKGIK